MYASKNVAVRKYSEQNCF